MATPLVNEQVTAVTYSDINKNQKMAAAGNATNEFETIIICKTQDIIINKVVLPTICILGMMGILTTVIVLSRKTMKTTTNSYLMSIAIADFIVLTILSTKGLGHNLSNEDSYKFTVYLHYGLIFLHTFLLASIWLTVMLAIERYIAICHPLHAMSICTISRARKLIIIIFIASFTVMTPKFWESKIVSLRHNQTTKDNGTVEVTIRYMQPTWLGTNMEYHAIYDWIIDGILTTILPFLALVILNCRLIFEIHKSNKYLKRNLGADSNMHEVISGEQVTITMMLVSMNVIFFICQSPYSISHFVFYTADCGHKRRFLVLHEATNVLLVLKSTINFVVYFFFSERFRCTFKRLFCLCYCYSKKPIRRDTSQQHCRTSYLISKETTC